MRATTVSTSTAIWDISGQTEALGDAPPGVDTKQAAARSRILRLLQELTHGNDELGPCNLDGLRFDHRRAEAPGTEPCVDPERHDQLHRARGAPRRRARPRANDRSQPSAVLGTSTDSVVAGSGTTRRAASAALSSRPSHSLVNAVPPPTDTISPSPSGCTTT